MRATVYLASGFVAAGLLAASLFCGAGLVLGQTPPNQPGPVVRPVGAPRPVVTRPSSGPLEAVGDGDLWASAQMVGESHQQLVLVHPGRGVVAVYHVDAASGKISLKSVRNIQADLEFTAFNTENPQPTDIQGMLQHSRP